MTQQNNLSEDFDPARSKFDVSYQGTPSGVPFLIEKVFTVWLKPYPDTMLGSCSLSIVDPNCGFDS